jgi:hypothetical protein
MISVKTSDVIKITKLLCTPSKLFQSPRTKERDLRNNSRLKMYLCAMEHKARRRRSSDAVSAKRRQ